MSYNPSDFLLSNYDYNLPQNAIAQNHKNDKNRYG